MESARKITPTPNTGPVLAEDPRLLPLIGSTPQTVHVSVDANDNVWFSMPDYPGKYVGMSWRCGGYSLLITFVFDEFSGPGIDELRAETPSCWFTDTYEIADVDQSRRQGCCIPSIPGTYHFFAKLGNKALVDPKIVVTPITA